MPKNLNPNHGACVGNDSFSPGRGKFPVAQVNATAAGRWLTKTDESQVSGVEASSAAASAISLKAGDTL